MCLCEYCHTSRDKSPVAILLTVLNLLNRRFELVQSLDLCALDLVSDFIVATFAIGRISQESESTLLLVAAGILVVSFTFFVGVVELIGFLLGLFLVEFLILLSGVEFFLVAGALARAVVTAAAEKARHVGGSVFFSSVE